MRVREHHDNLLISLKILVIESFQIDHSRIATFIKYGNPTGNTTISAIDYWQILLGLLFIQIMSNFVCNLFGIYLCNQTPKFTHPKINLNIQERTKLSRLSGSGMRNQGEERVDKH